MKLQIHTPAGAQTIDAPEDRPLSETLGIHHLHLDLRCGGRNCCNRCRISLLSGKFRLGTTGYDASAAGKCETNACIAFPDGPEGAIEIPAASLPRNDARVETGFRFPPELSSEHPGSAVAIDIGTTTVAAALIVEGQVVKTAGIPNAQFRFGDNVIDRIAAAGRSPGMLRELQRVLVDESINLLIGELTSEPEQIRRIAVAANTVMTHIFYGCSPASIGEAPFRPEHLDFPMLPASSFGIAAPNAEVAAVPALTGPVGGDVAGGMLVSGFGRDPEKPELFLDLGTNCEMVLAANGKFYASAAAAGPAFEGSGLPVGCRAIPGAIDHIAIAPSGSIHFHMLGANSKNAVGICGSGMLDFLSSGRSAGLLDRFGRFDRNRLGQLGRLDPGDARRGCGCRLTSQLTIFESDIETLLKAKAAVQAGILALLDYASIPSETLKNIYLAGGFARYLKLDSARTVGLLPKLPDDRFRVCGNTSLAAAAVLSCRPHGMSGIENYRKQLVDLPLNSIRNFERFYINSVILA